jgi:phage terminase large subunit-like protein
VSDQRIGEIALALARHAQLNRLKYYQPYPFQQRFHNLKGKGVDGPARVKCALTANQVGKSWAGSFETAIHLTGEYPDWYEGIRFRGPVKWLCAGVTNELTRDICQARLFGDPTDPRALGTGTVPLQAIGRQTRKTGVPDALDMVRVKHKSGRWSVVQFKCYEQGADKFMGIQCDGYWLDEEPPPDIFSQVKRAGFAKTYSVGLLTFTAEKGFTEVVTGILEDLPAGYGLVQATWEDAPHMTPELRAQKLADIPAHEREMRSKGAVFAGAGLCFTVSDDAILVDPFKIPAHWRRLIAIDFGFDHPFAAAHLAHNADDDRVYLIGEYYESHALPPTHCAAIRPWTDGGWVPIVWPHDGLQTQKGDGSALIMQYRMHPNLYFLPHHFTNPPNVADGETEGEGAYHIEPGVIEMATRMETGRFKVFRGHCPKFMQEKRTYHRDSKTRKIVSVLDDMVSATRYGVMSLRHARTKPIKVNVNSQIAVGASNW